MQSETDARHEQPLIYQPNPGWPIGRPGPIILGQTAQANEHRHADHVMPEYQSSGRYGPDSPLGIDDFYAEHEGAGEQDDVAYKRRRVALPRISRILAGAADQHDHAARRKHQTCDRPPCQAMIASYKVLNDHDPEYEGVDQHRGVRRASPTHTEIEQ